MYTDYFFIAAFAVLITSAASDDSVSATIDGHRILMKTDQVCRSAGFVHKNDPKVKTAEIGHLGSLAGGEPVSNSMTTADIILTVLGVAAALLSVAFVGNYCYNKHKGN